MARTLSPIIIHIGVYYIHTPVTVKTFSSFPSSSSFNFAIVVRFFLSSSPKHFSAGLAREGHLHDPKNTFFFFCSFVRSFSSPRHRVSSANAAQQNSLCALHTMIIIRINRCTLLLYYHRTQGIVPTFYIPNIIYTFPFTDDL